MERQGGGLKQLFCVACESRFNLGPEFAGCRYCLAKGKRSPLEVVYDYAEINRSTRDTSPGRGCGKVWEYRQLLPVDDCGTAVSLAEGGTSLFQLEPLCELAGLPQLYLKNETTNPTWSYKDRANTVAISVARGLGFRKVVTLSTGNHGCSVAAYCGAARLECVVLSHEEISPALVNLIHLYGGRVVVGGDREGLLSFLVAQNDWFPAVTVFPFPQVCSPYGVEGFKTIAYEIFEQLGNESPEHVFVPVGSGDGCYGIWKGFRELRTLGFSTKVPRIYACQAEGCNPVVRSFRARSEEVVTVHNGYTSALSICESTSSPLALQAVYQSGGEALDCSEAEMEEMWRSLGRLGISVEPASAVAVACARKLAEERRLGSRASVVCILTGAAVKWPEFTATHLCRTPICGNTIEDGRALLEALTRRAG